MNDYTRRIFFVVRQASSYLWDDYEAVKFVMESVWEGDVGEVRVTWTDK